MKKKYYVLVEETNQEQQTVYGVAIFEKKSQNNAIELSRVSNITCDKSALEALVCCCNSLNLSPIHLDEVIEDFLLNQ